MSKLPIALIAALFAGTAFCVTPGVVEKVVPQGGIDKIFKVHTKGDVEVRVQFYTPEVFRIMAAVKNPTNDTYTVDFSDPKNNPEKAQILVDATQDASRVVFKDSPETYTFKTSALTLSLKKADCTFSVFDTDGSLIFGETKPIDLNEKTVQSLTSSADEFYYGGGQQNGYFSHKGRCIDIKADGNWEEGGHPNPAPFYLSNAGYGVLRHTFAIGSYDFTKNDEVLLTHNEKRFDAFYFVGKTMPQIVNLYTKFTGRPNFIPVWGLELGDADAYMTRDKTTKDPVVNEDGTYKEITPDVINRVAEKYREHNMPCGWILVNDGYGCGYVQLNYVVKALKDLGFYTGLWTEGALDRIRWEVGTAGTRVQKIDVAWSGPAYQHGLECNKVAFDGIEDNSDARAFVWTVQGWAGTQRYGVCWTGDQSGSWDLIRYHIPTLTGSGLSGQAYATTDVDGIFGGSAETYTRDLQWKCFTPAMYVMNGWSHLPKYPWAYDEPYRSINRKFLLQKLRLTPYMYTYCRNAYDTGAPIVRPMVWNYPEDRYTWDEKTKYQFMLGDSFLVAPVYTSMRINKGWRKGGIYLPAGQWIDYNDGRRTNGPANIEAYPIDLEKIPVFVKAGSIIPMYPEMLYSTEKPKDTVTFDIYPYGNSSFCMYEDDGTTRDYKTGEFATQNISCSAPEGKSGNIEIEVEAANGSFKGQIENRRYEFQIHSQIKPENIFLNGDEMLELTSTNNVATVFKNARTCWYYDANDKYGIVHVKVDTRSIRESLSLFLKLDEKLEIAATEPYPIPEITDDLDKTLFVVSSNSQSGGEKIQNAFDGSDETIWHSNYNKNAGSLTNFPYEIKVDIGVLAALNGVSYTPRKGLGNGVLKDYEIFVSRNKNLRGNSVAKGAFPKFKDQTPAKITFPDTWGRYVTMVFTSAQNGRNYGSAAEFDILQNAKAEPIPDETKPIGTKEISVDGVMYKNSIPVKLGENELVFDIDGTYEKVLGHAGMASGNKNRGTVTFRIFADDKQIFERLGMNGSQVKQLINVEIPSEAKKLRFVFTPQENCDGKETGVWTDVKFFRAGSQK